MHLYSWRGCDKKGRIFTGNHWGENQWNVAEFVRDKYGYVLEIKRAQHGTKGLLSRIVHLSDKQKGLFFGRLASLLDRGIPLLRGLELIEEKSSQNIGRVCSILQTDLEKGLSFSIAIRKQPLEFSSLSAQVIEAGETSGQLAMMLEELSGYYLKERETKRFLFNACLYPGLGLVLTFLTMGYFAFEVLPMFGKVYVALGIKTGEFLLRVIETVEILKMSPKIIGIFWVMFCLCCISYRKKLPVLFLNLPIIRNYHKTFLEIRCCRLLGILLTSGITLYKALGLVEGTLPQGKLRRENHKIKEKVLLGNSLGEAATLHKGMFSRVTREFIFIGENGGNLDIMLTEAAHLLDGDLEAGLKDFKVILEPVLLLILALIVGSGFCFLLAPVYDLLNKFTEF